MKTVSRFLSSKKDIIIFFFLVGIGIIVRTILFGKIPSGFNQDEASIGYDAFSILKYGVDRNGIYNPIHLIAWGSGQNALYAYLAMPFISIFGLSIFSVRLVNLVFGIISIIIFYFLVKKVTNTKLAKISLFLIIISPWHIMISRWGLESNLFPAMFLIATYLLILSLDYKRLFPISLIVYALCLYAYGTAYFFIPIYLIIVLTYFYYHKKITLKMLFTGCIFFIITALPIFLFVVVNTFNLDTIETFLFSIPKLSGPARHTVISSIFSEEFITNSYNNLKIFLKLIITQNDDLIWNSIPKYGYMYLLSLPFLILGVIRVIYKNIISKNFEKSFIFIAWIFVCILLGFVTKVNINRINIIFLSLIYFLSEGILFVIKNNKYIKILIIGIYIISFSLFSFEYFTEYPEQIEQKFFESFKDAIIYASDKPSEKIYVTNSVNMPYIHVLFHEKINPHDFLNTVEYYNPGSHFQNVKSFGKYKFGINKIDSKENAVYIINNLEENKFDKKYFDFKRFKYYSVVTVKE